MKVFVVLLSLSLSLTLNAAGGISSGSYGEILKNGGGGENARPLVVFEDIEKNIIDLDLDRSITDPFLNFLKDQLSKKGKLNLIFKNLQILSGSLYTTLKIFSIYT